MDNNTILIVDSVMESGQELTHTVTTTISAEKQTVTNETQLVDGGDIVLKTIQTVSIPVGQTYNIQTKGDINGQTIKRILNMANNLVGVNAFKFENESDATDTDNVSFTAAYDAKTLTFSGTAPLNSIVRIILEDGTSAKLSPDSLGAWQHTITEDQLQYGTNNIAIINGTSDAQLAMINIEREKPVTPFNDTFSAVLSNDGRKVSGTVADTRATIFVQVGATLFSVIPRVDATWSYDFETPLKHGDSVDVSVSYQDVSSAIQALNYYVDSAELDQNAGQYVRGTSEPYESISVSTSKYGSMTVQADATGKWQADFATGLPTGSTVGVTINAVALPVLTYTGGSDIDYNLVFQVTDSDHIQGKTEPNTDVVVTIGSNPSIVVKSDSTGYWGMTLTTALVVNDVIHVQSGSDTKDMIYVEVTAFSAVLGEDKATVTGSIDAAAKVRITFDDSSELNFDVAIGDFSLQLGRTLNAGESVEVSCIVNNAIHTIITVVA